jgi:hypothetical protein
MVPSPISRLIFSAIDWWQNLNFFCDPQGHKAYESISFVILIGSFLTSAEAMGESWTAYNRISHRLESSRAAC